MSLFKRKVTPSSKGSELFNKAACDAREEIARCINEDDLDQLTIQLNKLTDAQLQSSFIEIQADINSEYRAGNDLVYEKPINYAARSGSEEALSLVMQSGACFDSSTVKQTFRYGKTDNCKLLLTYINPDDLVDSTLLHEIPNKYAEDFVPLLVEHGVDLNSRNMEGATPLIDATEKGEIKKLQALIQAGADLFATNARGETAYDIADHFLNGDKKIREILDDAMIQALYETDPRLKRLQELTPPADTRAARIQALKDKQSATQGGTVPVAETPTDSLEL